MYFESEYALKNPIDGRNATWTENNGTTKGIPFPIDEKQEITKLIILRTFMKKPQKELA